MSEWQTIETAPKDKKVLLSCGYFVSVGRWETQEFHKKPKPHWSTERGYVFGKRFDLENQPTHWMPIPIPPKQD